MKRRCKGVRNLAGVFAFIAIFANTVTAATLLTDITVGNKPGDITVTPDGNKVYVGNVTPKNISVIDTATNTVTATVPAGDHPTDVQVTPDGSEVWVSNRFDGTITVIDTSSDTVSTTIPNLGIGLIDDITFTPDGTKAYVVTDNTSGTIKTAIVDTVTRTVIGTITTPGAQEKILFSPDGLTGYIPQQMVGAPNSRSTIVFDPATNTFDPSDTISVLFLRLITSSGDYGWASHPSPSSVFLVDLINKIEIDDIPVASRPNGMVLSPNEEWLYVVNDLSNQVSIINTNTRSIIETVSIADLPAQLVVTPDGTTLYVTRFNTNKVAVVDLVEDEDEDGVADDNDNCPSDANPNQTDTDEDGAGDVCDDDDDNDTVLDDDDNCPLEANTNQTDTDEDGAGDVCDSDDDNDDILDADDACPGTPNGEIVMDVGEDMGCSIDQLCPCDNDWKNHGAYVSCTAHAADGFVNAGLISDTEKGEIVSEAAQSGCGKKK